MINSNSIASPGIIRNDKVIALTQIVLCSLLIGFCAQIRIPLFFTPVPITIQTLAVMVVACMLGSRKGALSVALYVFESVLGLPVLSGGRSDMFALASPIGGYLLGYIFQAYLVGWFVERSERLGKSMVFAGILTASALQLFFGALWLGIFIGYSKGIMLGAIPFIPVEIVKVLAVTTFLRRSV